MIAITKLRKIEAGNIIVSELHGNETADDGADNPIMIVTMTPPLGRVSQARPLSVRKRSTMDSPVSPPANWNTQFRPIGHSV